MPSPYDSRNQSQLGQVQSPNNTGQRSSIAAGTAVSRDVHNTSSFRNSGQRRDEEMALE